MNDDTLYEAHPPMFRNNPIGFIAAVILVPVGVGLLILGIWYLSSRSKTLTITNDRLRYVEGILSKNRIELRLSSIRSIRVNQNVFQRLFGTGDIQIYSAGDAPEVTIKGLPDPSRVRELTN